MKYTLSKAAKATGKNRSTIQRAIKSGKISATKDVNGAYEIAPSELHRIYPPSSAQPDAHHEQGNNTQQGGSALEINQLERVFELKKELAIAQERAIGLEAQKDQMAETINDLRERLDGSERRITALLPAPRPKRNFLSRLLGQ